MRKLILATVFLSTLAAAQDSSTRLATAARLWARIHYTHPWLAGKDIDWDRAFAEAAPRILSAGSKEEYATAVNGMLAALGDPATYLRTPIDPGQFTPRLPSFQRDGDIVVLDPGIGGPEPFQKVIPDLLAELAKADVRGLVIDARNSPSFIQRWSDSITGHSTPGLVTVGRNWSGYPNPQTGGGGYGGYQHALSSVAGAKVTGSPKGTVKPIVVVAGERTNTPAGLIALQIAGKVAFVLEGDHRYDAVVPQTSMPLSEGLAAAIRTSEFTHADGTYGFVAQREVERGGLEAAFEIVRAGITAVTTRPRGFQLRPFAENAYADQPYPSEGLRMLGALRVWSVFEYFFPYKHLIGEDWGAVLSAALEEARIAKDALAYHQAIARLVARTNDTHCFVSSPVLNRQRGNAPPPFSLRWVEGRPVVVKVTSEGAALGVRAGDVVVAMDGRPFLEVMDELKPLVAASTPQSKIARVLAVAAQGADGSKAQFTLEGAAGVRREVDLPRRMAHYQGLREKDGPVYRKLDDRIGYVDLERLENGQVDTMFNEFKDTGALILDMRGYPRGTAWSIAPRLSSADQPVNAQFRRNLLNGGQSENLLFEQKLPPRGGAPLYKGRTVMLIDERAISQSEHSGLMYRTANGTLFIGEPTAGANGDVTYFMAPGGIRISFSGHDVRWPDGRQLQRVGLHPDVAVAPTVQGIRDGRDEVLEKALEFLRK
ncbi:MAG: S41 family peptidase [Bryobacteraceae bacterium]